MSKSEPTKIIDLKRLDHNDRFADYADAGDVARALMALDAGRMGSWSHDIARGEIRGDRLVASLLNFDFDAQPWTPEDFFQTVHPDDVPLIAQAVEDAYSGKNPFYDVEVRANPTESEREAGIVRWIGGRGQVTQRDEDGNPLQVIGVNWDATEAKQHEERLSMLASEMDHRVKNAFAVIRALVNIGTELAADKDSFANTLRSQVEAMATAHTLSAQMARNKKDATAPVALSEVVHTALAPWIEIGEDTHTSVTINCDADINLPPSKIGAFAMMIYELSTNATKYGPLGEMGGALNVTIMHAENGGLTLFWRETVANGPLTEAAQNEQAGFGEVLLSHCANTLDAEITRKMTPDGLHLHLDIKPSKGV